MSVLVYVSGSLSVQMYSYYIATLALLVYMKFSLNDIKIHIWEFLKCMFPLELPDIYIPFRYTDR